MFHSCIFHSKYEYNMSARFYYKQIINKNFDKINLQAIKMQLILITLIYPYLLLVCPGLVLHSLSLFLNQVKKIFFQWENVT